jgi:hypothetical protein
MRSIVMCVLAGIVLSCVGCEERVVVRRPQPVVVVSRPVVREVVVARPAVVVVRPAPVLVVRPVPVVVVKPVVRGTIIVR